MTLCRVFVGQVITQDSIFAVQYNTRNQLVYFYLGEKKRNQTLQVLSFYAGIIEVIINVTRIIINTCQFDESKYKIEGKCQHTSF